MDWLEKVLRKWWGVREASPLSPAAEEMLAALRAAEPKGERRYAPKDWRTHDAVAVCRMSESWRVPVEVREVKEEPMRDCGSATNPNPMNLVVPVEPEPKVYTLGKRRFVEDGPKRHIAPGEFFWSGSGRVEFWSGSGITAAMYQSLRLLPDEEEIRAAKEQAWQEGANAGATEVNPYAPKPPPIPARAMAVARSIVPELAIDASWGREALQRRLESVARKIASHYPEEDKS